MNEKVREDDTDIDREADLLINKLGGHNAREEYALYPQLDKLLSATEKDAAFVAISAIPEGST